jgi:hypothetical protein
MTTTEQTEDDLTKKRRLSAVTARMANAVVTVARAIEDLRRDGLGSRVIVRNLVEEIRGVFPREAEFLRDESMIDTMSSLLDLLGVILGPNPDHMDIARRLIAQTEGDPLFAGVVAKMESAMDHLTAIPAVALPPTPPPSWATIQRLFKEHPSPLPDQTPAIECGVMLRGVPVTLMGSLSETPEGGLRLLSPDPSQERPIRPGTPMKMVEQFFDYEDVMVVAVRRRVTMEAPRIIQS